MEFILTCVLLCLLSVAVCNLFGTKAKVTVIITVVVLVLYIAVIIIAGDSRSMFSTFWLWLTTMWDEIKEVLGIGAYIADS